MNRFKQFWTLCKFQTTINPFAWFMLIAFAAPLVFTGTFSMDRSYHPNLASLLIVQNLFMVGLVGLWALAPEMAQPWGSSISTYSGTEFLLTRAIDRPILYRCRATYFYFLILLLPLTSLLYSLKSPDLKVTEYSKAARQECLSHVPGCILEKDPSGSRSPLIGLPRGNVLVNEWYLIEFVLTALSVQVIVLLIHPLKHRYLIFYALFMSAIFLPLIPLFMNLRDTHGQTPPYTERVFFFFAAHQSFYWGLLALLFILAQLLGERRFAQLEQ